MTAHVHSTVGRRPFGLLLAATLAVAALVCAATAQAMTFPGANGKIAFERGNETAEHDIYAIDPDGSGEVNLTHNGSNNRQIAWSPDGSRVAFFSDGDGSDNYYDIHVAPVDGSGPVRLADTGNAHSPAWSPDGQSVAFSDGYLYVVHADGTGLRAVAGPRTGSPFWSPDGTKIAFVADYGDRSDIYVVNADGSRLTRLTDDSEFPGNWMSWSPDGTRIAYVAGRLYVMNADGSNKRKLSDTDGFYPTWAPDGSKISFSALGAGVFQVFTINPDGTGETQVTNGTTSSYGPGWSPDSTQLVFERQSPTFGLDVYVINRDGTGERYVTVGEAPQWQSLPLPRDAKRLCKAARKRLGNKAFRKRYGTKKNGTDAFSNCVAGLTR
jgi:Tol biopolymer transport system component